MALGPEKFWKSLPTPVGGTEAVWVGLETCGQTDKMPVQIQDLHYPA